MAQPVMLGDGGGDPRLNALDGRMADFVAPQHRRLHDPNVTFEEYYHYAKECRAEEDANRGSAANQAKGIMSTLFPSKGGKREDVANTSPVRSDMSPDHEKDVNLSSQNARMEISDQEWTNASRALRLATWPAMFYLITTDILGPYGLPYAIATTGWGPGVTLYTIFGLLAGYSGYLIWKMFLDLDSYQFPLRSYGDLAYRIFGRTARHGVNILQSIQLLCNVGVIVIQNGQSLSQVAKFKLCYAVCCLIWAILGFGLGQVRTLQKFGWLANGAIWLNMLVIFITMGVAANSAPNYTAAQSASAGAVISGPGGPLVAQLPDGSYPAKTTQGSLPNAGDFSSAVTGLMQAVYAYGGAMLFVEFMSEMRRPRDFIKAMWGAQAFIYFFYMLYGCFMYGYQGQYVINPSYQGLSPYNWQAATNVIAMVSALIAAALYGNIGVKVLYNNIFVEFFSAPPLASRKGKFLWAAIIPVYWTIAFIVAASIPNFSGMTSVVAALCILQFTYSFPPLLYIGYLVQRDAIQAGEGFNPATGQTTRHDSGAKRWFRAMKKQWYNHIWLWIYGLGALVTAALGAYAGIETLIAAFENPAITAFTCTSPLDA